MTMATSWSYVPDDTYKPASQLIRLLAGIVAKGGNFLLNIGPAPDGTLPAVALGRLREIGNWMDVNGPAIYSTRAIAPYTEGNICFTRNIDGSVNAIVLGDDKQPQPPDSVTIASFAPAPGSQVTMRGVSGPVPWSRNASGFTIRIPEGVRKSPPCKYAWSFRFIVG